MLTCDPKYPPDYPVDEFEPYDDDQEQDETDQRGIKCRAF